METVIKSEQICDIGKMAKEMKQIDKDDEIEQEAMKMMAEKFDKHIDEVVKKQRGRPRKYPLEDKPPKKPVGRPRKISLEEKPPKKPTGRPLGTIKEGYRTADDKDYFNNY